MRVDTLSQRMSAVAAALFLLALNHAACLYAPSSMLCYYSGCLGSLTIEHIEETRASTASTIDMIFLRILRFPRREML